MISSKQHGSVFKAAVWSFLLAACVFSLSGGLHPVQAVQGSAKFEVMFLHPLVDIYEGDTVTFGYWVEDPDAYGGITLAPLTPGDASATARLGTVTVQPDGLHGTISYTAQKTGDEEIVLQVSNAVGTGMGSINLKVLPRPNYELKFAMISADENESGGGFRAIFSGEGQFANKPDAPITGKGQSDMWFALWVSNEVMACSLEPVVQGSTPFEISGVSGPAALVPGSAVEDSMILDLNFQPISLNESLLHCDALGGIEVNYPWPAATSDPNIKNLKSLLFDESGGFLQITAPKTWGYIIVSRIDE